jgi:hypothetical protein
MPFVLKFKSGQPLSGFVDEGRRKNEPALRPLLKPVSLQFGLANLVCLLFIACDDLSAISTFASQSATRFT